MHEHPLEYAIKLLLFVGTAFFLGFVSALFLVLNVEYLTDPKTGRTNKIVTCGFKRITGDSPVNETGCGDRDTQTVLTANAQQPINYLRDTLDEY